MITNQCVSITDLRMKTKECIQNAKDNPQYIFVNNRPVAVIIDIKEYEKDFYQLRQLPESDITPKMRREVERVRKIPKHKLLNI